MALKRNIGGLDRVFRIGISLIMFYFGLLDSGALAPLTATLLTALGAANLIATLAGYCPLYTLAGIDTSETDGGQ